MKASAESHAEVGDRANDVLRVDGADLRCRVVGEGGNLGFTQRGRIEFAVAGGRINTDAIDNSAGVDCSDHEVNLKILLAQAIEAGELTIEGSATSCWSRSPTTSPATSSTTTTCRCRSCRRSRPPRPSGWRRTRR